MRKTIYLKEKDIEQLNKEQLIKLTQDNNIVLIGIKTSILWTEKFQNEKEKI